MGKNLKIGNYDNTYVIFYDKKIIIMRIFRRRSAITHFVNINYVHYNEIKSGIYFKIIIPVLRYYQLKRSTVCGCGNTYNIIFCI